MADLCVQGMILTEAELQGIIATHDLDRNGVFDEVLTMSCDLIFLNLWAFKCTFKKKLKNFMS
jgi:hypothetical protein